MAKAAIIEERTDRFICEYKRLKDDSQLPDNKILAKMLGIRSASTLSNILARNQNIRHEAWKKFKEIYGIIDVKKNSEGSLAGAGKEDKFSPEQLFEMFLHVSAAQTKILDRIENSMARQDSQATIADKVKGIESNLTRVLVGVETLSGDYETGIAEMRGFFAQSTGNKKRPSRGGGKKSGRIDGAGKKRGSNP